MVQFKELMEDLLPGGQWPMGTSEDDMALFFESAEDAQAMYDFITGASTGVKLLEPGEVLLMVQEGYGPPSLIFSSTTVLLKPEIIAAVLEAYEDQFGADAVAEALDHLYGDGALDEAYYDDVITMKKGQIRRAKLKLPNGSSVDVNIKLLKQTNYVFSFSAEVIRDNKTFATFDIIYNDRDEELNVNQKSGKPIPGEVEKALRNLISKELEFDKVKESIEQYRDGLSEANPYHDKEGNFTSKKQMMRQKKGSFALGKRQQRLSPKSKKNPLFVAVKKLPCGRAGREAGTFTRCYDSKKVQWTQKAVAQAMKRKRVKIKGEAQQLSAHERIMLERAAAFLRDRQGE